MRQILKFSVLYDGYKIFSLLVEATWHEINMAFYSFVARLQSSFGVNRLMLWAPI